MSRTPATVRCDFCGFEFDPACTEACCQGCPLTQGCSRITCPRCGYEMLPEAKLIGLMRQVKDRWQALIRKTKQARHE